MRLWRLYYPKAGGDLELAAGAVLGESQAAAIARARMLGLVDRRRRMIALELEAVASRRSGHRRRIRQRPQANNGG